VVDGRFRRCRRPRLDDLVRARPRREAGAGRRALTLSVTNPDSGSATEEIEVDYEASPLDIGFNARYLLDIAGQLEGDTALFKLADPGSPTLIQDREGAIRALCADADARVRAGVFSASIRLADGRRLGTGTEHGDGGAIVRKCRMDGAAVGSPAAFGEVLRLVWLTPASDGLFVGPAGDRRRFLDRLVLAVDSSHGARVSALERALRSRNRLLEDERADTAWLDAIEREVAETGVAVAAARRETVERLTGIIAAGRDDSSPFPWADIALTGPLDAELAHAPAVDVEDLYRGWLRVGRSRDRAVGRTLLGPQASDLAVHHGPKGVPAGQASTGEQKALLVGLVWRMRGWSPTWPE
jgi:hypothetical protein